MAGRPPRSFASPIRPTSRAWEEGLRPLPPARRMDAFRVLGVAASTWARGALVFAGLSALFHLPLGALLVLREGVSVAPATYTPGIVVLVAALGSIASAPIAWRVAAVHRGIRPSFLACAGRGLAHVVSAGAIWVVQMGGVVVPFLFACVVFLLLYSVALPASASPLADGALLLAIAISVAPFLWAYGRRWVALPVSLVERTPFVDAIERSTILVEGNAFQVAVVVVASVVVEAAAAAAIARTLVPEHGYGTALGVYLAARALVFVPLRAVACATTHEELWRARETDTRDVARVFE